MAEKYKLSYFNLTALGEPIRFLLSYGGLDFEDDRVDMDAWWDLKPKTPFGHLPTLERDGKISHQCIPLCRYIAKQVNLTGKDDWEDLEIDATVHTIDDLRMKIALYYYKYLKETGPDSLNHEVIPFYLERLDAQVKKSNGFLVGNRLTWADLYLVSLLDYMNAMMERDIIADYPNLLALNAKVLEIPNIKNWIQTRPSSVPCPEFFVKK